jgi:hypothetical protein
MNRPSAITPHEKRLPKSGNTARVAGAVVQVVLGVEFFLTGLSKVVDRRYLADFSALRGGIGGGATGTIRPSTSPRMPTSGFEVSHRNVQGVR